MSRVDPGPPIRVLVADESPAQRAALSALIGADPQLALAGTAASGPEAVQATLRLRPAVAALSVDLPQLDGYAAARQIMQRCPTPIVLLSAAEPGDTSAAQAAGALALVRKPGAQQAEQAHLLTTLRLMAGVRVVTRFASRAPGAGSPLGGAAPRLPSAAVPAGPLVLAIAASTGGPGALQTLLGGLPTDFPLPIAIVQHIAVGFGRSLADWLRQAGGRPTHLVSGAEPLQAGHVYLAGDGRHLVLRQAPGGTRLAAAELPSSGDAYCPSADQLFRSVAQVCGSQAIGVILTGMGDDGARGLLELAQAGAMTLAQDQASSVVYGMPQAALKAGAVRHMRPLGELAGLITQGVALADAQGTRSF
ncbi:MAG TPA: chemotaxis protein CheB [Herpetosiphonaceae bacterium]